MKKIIPIVYVSDKNFLWPCSVSIVSLLKNANENTFYDIYILIKKEFSEEMELMTSITDTYTTGKINFIIVGEVEVFDQVDFGDSRWGAVVLYRLLIPKLLLQYKKVISLDADTIIAKDLSSLFDTDICDYYLAGARGLHHNLFSESEAYRLKLGNKILDFYMSASVILMNLEKIREDNIDNKWINLVTEGYYNPEQDIMNIICANKIKRLPFKYNHINCLKKTSKYGEYKLPFRFTWEIDVDIIKEYEEEPYIIDYSGVIRPWTHKTGYLFEEWWKYAEYSPFTSKQNYILREGIMKIEDAIDTIDSANGGYYIYSGGTFGEAIYKLLKKYAPNNIFLGFVDNRVDYQGKEFFGHIVLSYEQCKKDKNILFILSKSATNAAALLNKEIRNYLIVTLE